MLPAVSSSAKRFLGIVTLPAIRPPLFPGQHFASRPVSPNISIFARLIGSQSRVSGLSMWQQALFRQVSRASKGS
jgi:hypothetical protein